MNKITLENKVLSVLDKIPLSRNDDTLLTFKVIQEFMPGHVIRHEGKIFASLESLSEIREDNVKRVRAKIQNEKGLYLPTSPEVREKRRISEESWRVWSRS